ncbi:hypothetical protein HNR42_002030 [Deinobacterium chartae]|uniref:Uncharacterized protein n=1 Tax=Deinobacterium chartae TaxID=521158 RepID=A0A841I0G1_9DEIO|nr:hypothetical protein [Deinobacterium chartae]
MQRILKLQQTQVHGFKGPKDIVFHSCSSCHVVSCY